MGVVVERSLHVASSSTLQVAPSGLSRLGLGQRSLCFEAAVEFVKLLEDRPRYLLKFHS